VARTSPSKPSNGQPIAHQDLQEREKSVEAREERVTKREQSLKGREEAVEAQEKEAEADFVRLRDEKHAELQRELDRRREELERELSEGRARLNEETERLEESRTKLSEEQHKLDAERFAVQMEREDTVRQRARIEDQIALGVATTRGELESRLALVAAERDAALRQIEELRTPVADAARQALVFGGRDPSDVSDELEALRTRCAKLEAEVSRAGSGATRDELTAIRTENDGLREKNVDLIREAGELRASLERLRTDVNSRETMALRVKVAERHRDVLAQEVERLAAKYDELLVKERDQVPFARLTAIDEDPDAKRKPVKQKGGAVELAALVAQMRDRLAADEQVYLLDARLAGLHRRTRHESSAFARGDQRDG